jgi:hypothetical protein
MLTAQLANTLQHVQTTRKKLKIILLIVVTLLKDVLMKIEGKDKNNPANMYIDKKLFFFLLVFLLSNETFEDTLSMIRKSWNSFTCKNFSQITCARKLLHLHSWHIKGRYFSVYFPARNFARHLHCHIKHIKKLNSLHGFVRTILNISYQLQQLDNTSFIVY